MPKTRRKPALSKGIRDSRPTHSSMIDEQWFRATLYSIGDAVITVDHRGRVLQMNPVAEQLTGWKETQAQRKALSKVFRIVNEHTRKKVQNPVQRVMREGIVIGLANHTLLIARNGHEYPIADAGAPIKNQHGKVVGVVLVFRDQTAERNAQRAVQYERDFAESIIATMREPLLVLDQKLKVISANRSFYNVFQVSAEKTIGKKVYDLGNRQWNIPKLRALLEDILPLNSHFDDFEVTHTFENIGQRTMRLNARRVFHEENRPQLILLAIEDITIRKRAELERQEAEQRNRMIAEMISDYAYIFRVTPEGELIGEWVTDSFTKVFGYTLRQAQERGGWKTLVHPDDKAMAFAHAQKVASGMANVCEMRWVTASGEVRWLRDYAKPIFDETGTRVIRIYGASQDITERKNAEQAIRESEEWFRRLSDTTATAIFIYQGEKFVHVNRATELLTGYSKEELLNMKFWEVVHPDDASLVRERGLARQRGETVPNHYEFKILRKDGVVRWIDFTAGKIDWKHKPAAIGTGFDVTERKRAETSLMESEERFRTLIAHAPEAIVLLDPRTNKFISVNANACRLFELDEAALLIKGPVELSPPLQPDGRLSQESAHEKIHRALNGESLRFEWTHRTATGTDIPCEVLLVRLPSATDYLIRGSILDISERIKAKEDLQRSHARYEAFFMEDLTGDYISTPEGKLLACNPAFLKMFGFASLEEALDVNLTSLFPSPEDRRRLLSRIQAEKKLEYFDLHLIRRDGTPVYAIANLIGRFDAEGRLTEIQGYLFDDTRRRQLEEALRQAQKLESIGTLASGIAHDFNNILGIILGHAAVLEKVRDDRTKIEQSIAAIVNVTERGASLVKQLLAFARKTESLFEPLDLNLIVKELTKMLRETFPRAITIRHHMDTQLPPIVADATQMHQVLLNLCINARDAMPKGGTLTISTEQVDGSRLPKRFQAAAFRYIVLSVSDTGVGMDEQTRARIFEPFFTTKPPGHGTGLGLAVVHGVIGAHGGYIDVESHVGKGSTFRTYLPAVEIPKTELDSAPKSAPELHGGTETLLIAEDEKFLRQVLEASLTAIGYTVITAENGEQALELYRHRMSEITLIISDIGLPLLSGDELFRQVRQINPAVRFILASGFIDPKLRSDLVNAGVADLISKPYTIDEVILKIRKVLDRT